MVGGCYWRLCKNKAWLCLQERVLFSPGQVIVLTPGNFFEDGGFRSRGSLDRFYSGEFPREYILKKGDLIVAMTEQAAGLLGSPAIIPEDDKYLHNQRLGLVSITDPLRLCPDFLFLVLSLPSVRKHIETTAGGTKVKHSSPDKILSTPISIPSLDQQHRIVQVISAWDRAIEQAERLIAAKRRRKQALMQQLLTGKRRFKGTSGKPWRQVCLGDFFWERNESNRADLPLASITADRGVILRNELDKKDTSNEDKRLYKRIAPGDIGYNTMRMWQGVSALSSLEGIVSPAYTVCVPQADIDPRFAAYLFKFPPMVHLFHRHSQGLVDDTLNLKFSNFAKLRVTLPSMKEQMEITECLACCDREIDGLCQKRDAVKEQKKGLMQRLLTGKVRVVSL